MKQLTISVDDNKYEFFKELVESFGFTHIISAEEITRKKKKTALVKSVQAGLKEVEDIERGKVRSIPLKKLLDEL